MDKGQESEKWGKKGKKVGRGNRTSVVYLIKQAQKQKWWNLENIAFGLNNYEKNIQ